MREIYVFDSCDGVRLTPLSKCSQVNPQLKQAAEQENLEALEPFIAAGDPDVAFVTVFRQPEAAGGIVAVSAMNEVLFYVIANSSLNLIAAASHFASQVSNIRYGQDIFDNIDDSDE